MSEARSPEDVRAFLRVLDPSDDATGGGTASAVAGAMAAALAAMVARLSIGREGMEPEGYYAGVRDEGQGLADELFRGGREDSEAFDAVRAAFRLPRESEEERTRRSAAIQAAMVGAAHVPLENARRCRRVLDLCAELEGRSNPNVASDLTCAGELARAGLMGCLANVDINLPSIKDEGVRAEMAREAAGLRAAPAGPGDGEASGDADGAPGNGG